jgi:hypothetical protein
MNMGTLMALVRARGLLGAAVAASVTSAARAEIIVYNVTMSGPAESPPNTSPGVGSGIITIDTIAMTMRVQATFSGLLGNTTAAHIHAATPSPFSGTAGVATQTPTFVNFPLGVTSGNYDNTFDMALASSYNPAYITANGGTPASAFAALTAAMAQGRSYLNVHSTLFTGGEIRGFLPAPGAAALLGLAGLAAARRRRPKAGARVGC